MPVAGPVSPDGRMVVTYPDGNQVTWQFPMVEYRGAFGGLGPDGAFQLIDLYGRRGRFTFADPAGLGQTGTVQANIDWIATVRARFGFITGNSLSYVTGGWAHGGRELNSRLRGSPPKCSKGFATAGQCDSSGLPRY